MFIRGEVTAGQPLDPEAELAQSFVREVDVPVFKGILVAATHQERELIAIGIEELTEFEPIALCIVIGYGARSRGEVEQVIVAVHGGMEFVQLRVCYLIAFGPHLPYSWRPLEQREGTAEVPARRKCSRTTREEKSNATSASA